MFNRSLRALAAMLLVLTTLLSTAGLALAQDASAKNIVDTLSGMDNYVTLTSALIEKGVVNALSEGEYTLFAPNDGAWQALTVAERIKLYRASETLTNTLLHHTVEGIHALADLPDGTVLTSLAGDSLTITHDGAKVLVNGVAISSPDIAASNGIIHSVDALVPAGEAVTAGEEEVAEEVAESESEEGEAAAESTEVAATEAVTETAAAESTEVAATEAVTETAAAESTTEGEEEVREEVAASEAEEGEAAAAESTEAAPEAAAAPETLPETGAESSSLTLFGTAVLALLALGALAFATRSRA